MVPAGWKPRALPRPSPSWEACRPTSPHPTEALYQPGPPFSCRWGFHRKHGWSTSWPCPGRLDAAPQLKLRLWRSPLLRAECFSPGSSWLSWLSPGDGGVGDNRWTCSPFLLLSNQSLAPVGLGDGRRRRGLAVAVRTIWVCGGRRASPQQCVGAVGWWASPAACCC